MALKFYPIGSIVEYCHVKLQVVPQQQNLPSCAGCYFADSRQDKRRGIGKNDHEFNE